MAAFISLGFLVMAKQGPKRAARKSCLTKKKFSKSCSLQRQCWSGIPSCYSLPCPKASVKLPKMKFSSRKLWTSAQSTASQPVPKCISCKQTIEAIRKSTSTFRVCADRLSLGPKPRPKVSPICFEAFRCSTRTISFTMMYTLPMLLSVPRQVS